FPQRLARGSRSRPPCSPPRGSSWRARPASDACAATRSSPRCPKRSRTAPCSPRRGPRSAGSGRFSSRALRPANSVTAPPPRPPLQGLIVRGLGLVGDAPSAEPVRILAARAFAPRNLARATDGDWEVALHTAEEALGIAEELGLLREVSLCLDAVGYAYRALG